ncbi:hypothetical protein TPHA_0K01900 [Tetrapisispora phaffii CBS 4417]|uniref:pH-response regulator protein palF/RIM8 n=1 Tax=Tetrapisispora phaffii (strain ATCC 24235 / CBS 4417 / NBRC 1672 / NRRL Y-8282 / UCD 70-5) TaxID=1071381 RepID=G8BZJ4_TETPH|nr:hypothetical protein TPHA_0K01900 [Tetrapisispora phaffii CBS 4417]CCE65322.1 hypothetical protein TPHA_0K01900 [Tetrapisispora phaffii CBS 4417]
MFLLNSMRKEVSVSKKKRYVLGMTVRSAAYPTNITDTLTNMVSEYEIILDEPHKIWKPKEFVSGNIILRLSRDAYNVAIKFSLINEINLKMSKTTRMISKSQETVTENSAYLYGDESHLLNLTKGEHVFPFKFKLPKHKKSFSSIDFKRGSNEYYIRGFLKAANDVTIQTCEKRISVLVPLDVEKYSNAIKKTMVLQSTFSNASIEDSHIANSHSNENASSFMTKLTKSSSGSSSTKNDNLFTLTDQQPEKMVKVSVNVPHSGFMVGELIPVKVDIKHYKAFNHSAGLIATLTRICRVNGNSKDIPVETFRKDISQTTAPLFIDSESKEASALMYLKVPLDAIATFTALPNYFTFQYYIEVVVNLSKKLTVYTASNEIVGKYLDNSSYTSHQGSILKENFNSLQRNISRIMKDDDEYVKHNDNEIDVSFSDLINVERLKRSKNVTGMSIEIVIGSCRTAKPISPVSSISDEGHVEMPPSIENNEEINDTENYNSLNEWLTAPGHSNEALPTPIYTPNEDIKVNSDKLELEQDRLKELESDPPLF